MGYIYIIWSINFGENVYKIIKGSNTYIPQPGIEIINRFHMINETLAEQFLRSALYRFKYNDEFYRCPKEWLELACQYVQRKINRDEDIMDLDLPWL